MTLQNGASTAVGDHWRSFARSWALLGSPLRPSDEDIRIFGEMLATHTDLAGRVYRKNAWLLGITPEIASASWLKDFRLTAVEQSKAMIDAEWPGDTDHRHAICSDWLRAPFSDESFDLVIGDGCLTHVAFPQGLARLMESIHRCLRRDGYLMLRQFRRPDPSETPGDVLAALSTGAIGSIHAFKWRLLMALQGAADAPDVAVEDAWRVWSEAGVDIAALACARGWSLDQIGTMDIYRGSPARYNFMRFDDAIRYLRDAGFEPVAVRTGFYELAERCPCVLLRKREYCAGSVVS